MRAKVIIVDDEQHVRHKVLRFLDDYDVDVVGEYGDHESAVEAIVTRTPDLVVLDVQLRDATAFDVLADVGAAAMPATVFTTADDEYALRAFDTHAIAYLLKPFDRDDFRMVVEPMLGDVARGIVPAPLRSLMATLPAVRSNGTRALRWIMAKRPDRAGTIVETCDIHWIEAAGNYVYLHTASDRFVHRQPLGQLCKRLDPGIFARVHRSAIVNLGFVDHIEPWVAGDYRVRMTCGTELRMSRNFRNAFELALHHGTNGHAS